MVRLNEVQFDSAHLNKASAAHYSSSDSDADEDDDFLLPSRNPHDNESEFADHNPRKRRRTGRDAKESAALGIFGSESEDEGQSRAWKHKPLRNKGVSFVSSAKPEPASDDDDDDEEMKEDGVDKGKEEDEGEEEEEEEEEEKEKVTHSWRDAVKASRSFVRSEADTTNPLGDGFIPTSARVPTLLVKDEEPAAPRPAMRSAFVQGKGGKTKINAGSFGARMMAKMGYVEGKGLGKEGEGRNVIVEANLRPQRVGLGAVKEKTEQERQEEKRQARLRGEEVVDSEEENKKKRAARRKKALTGGISSGAASGGSTPRRQKPKYLTLDEIKKAAPGLDIPDAFTPILDMTGPGKKMLTSSSGLMTPTAGVAPTEPTEAAETRKLVRRAQNDFMAILEEWKSLQERKAYLELQLAQEKQELEELSASLQGNQSVTAACETASQPTESGEQDRKADLSYRLDRVISGLGKASDSLSESMLPQIKSELASLAVAAIHPLFNQFRQLWEPLEEPKPAFVDGLNSIRTFLGLDQQHNKKTYRRPTATPYETMMYELWLRTVTAAVREWSVRDPDPLLALLDAWDPLLPSFVRAQLLQEIIRRLDEAVQKWQPRSSSKHGTHHLPHRWIFPWLPYLSASHLDPRSSTGLVADVRRKFRQLIDAWDFRKGVIPGLRQWRDVLSHPAVSSSASAGAAARGRDAWTPLVLHHLLPAMARHLRAHFRVEPQDQAPYLDALDKLFEWLGDGDDNKETGTAPDTTATDTTTKPKTTANDGIITPPMLGELLVAEVFPSWHAALHAWLLLEEADYDEIGAWFAWWQDEVFPASVRVLPSIKAEFEKGLAMIETALDMGWERARRELPVPERGPALKLSRDGDEKGKREEERRKEKEKERDREKAKAKKPEEVSFREVMEAWCQEHDLQFMPERNKVHAEGPLYRISGPDGKRGVLVYFKGDSLFVQVKDKSPVRIRRDSEDEWGTLLGLVG